LSTVVNADKIAVIQDGVVVEQVWSHDAYTQIDISLRLITRHSPLVWIHCHQGTHEELLKLQGGYHRLVKRQITRSKNTISDKSYEKEEAGGKAGAAEVSVDSLLDELDEHKVR